MKIIDEYTKKSFKWGLLLTIVIFASQIFVLYFMEGVSMFNVEKLEGSLSVGLNSGFFLRLLLLNIIPAIILWSIIYIALKKEQQNIPLSSYKEKINLASWIILYPTVIISALQSIITGEFSLYFPIIPFAIADAPPGIPI